MKKKISFESDSYFGIDPSEMKPGDVITHDQLQELFIKNPRKSNRLEFFVLQLKQDIIAACANAGRPVAVRQKRGDMHIIQGNEMSEYCGDSVEMSIKRAARYTAMINQVVVDEMTPEEKKDHDRRAFVATEQISAIAKARNKLKLSAGSINAVLSNRSAIELPDMEPTGAK